MTCNCNKNPIKLGVKRLYKDVQLPQYTHVGDACFDIRVYIGDNESFFTDGSIPPVEDGEKSVPHKHRDEIPLVKVLEILKNFFQEVFKQGLGQSPKVLKGGTNEHIR